MQAQGISFSFCCNCYLRLPLFFVFVILVVSLPTNAFNYVPPFMIGSTYFSLRRQTHRFCTARSSSSKLTVNGSAAFATTNAEGIINTSATTTKVRSPPIVKQENDGELQPVTNTTNNDGCWREAFILPGSSKNSNSTPIQITNGQTILSNISTYNTQLFTSGQSILLLPNAASNHECQTIVSQARRKASIYRTKKRRLDGQISDMVVDLVRLPTASAAIRAAKAGTPCADAIDCCDDGKVEKTCMEILKRIMKRIDEDLPHVVQALFGYGDDEHTAILHQLFLQNKLQYASREPAVNIYTPPSGKFLAHEDGQTLTILVPLVSSDSFQGGGTAFWSPDARSHRVEKPGIVVRPEKEGTAILFVGSVTHAGLPVVDGERIVLVASFGLKRSNIDDE